MNKRVKLSDSLISEIIDGSQKNDTFLFREGFSFKKETFAELSTTFKNLCFRLKDNRIEADFKSEKPITDISEKIKIVKKADTPSIEENICEKDKQRWRDAIIWVSNCLKGFSELPACEPLSKHKNVIKCPCEVIWKEELIALLSADYVEDFCCFAKDNELLVFVELK